MGACGSRAARIGACVRLKMKSYSQEGIAADRLSLRAKRKYAAEWQSLGVKGPLRRLRAWAGPCRAFWVAYGARRPECLTQKARDEYVANYCPLTRVRRTVRRPSLMDVR